MPTDPVRAGSWPMKESRLVETKSEDAPWWLSSPHLDGSMRKLFSTYVDLEDDEILGHIRLHVSRSSINVLDIAISFFNQETQYFYPLNHDKA